MTTWGLCADPLVFLDLAHWQGENIPWRETMALGVEGAISKTWHGDRVVKSNVLQLETAIAAGLPVRGRYAWALPDEDLVAQARIWTSAPRRGDELPVMIDWEEPNTRLRGRPLVERGERMIEEASDRLGCRPIIYTGLWYWKQFCGEKTDSEIFASCDLVLAAYPRKNADGTRYMDAVAEVCGGVMPGVPHPWLARGLEPLGWQFDGDKGLYLPRLSNGMRIDVDVNIGSRSRILAYLNASAPSPSSAPDTIPATAEGRRKSSHKMQRVDAPIIEHEPVPATQPLWEENEGQHTVKTEDPKL